MILATVAYVASIRIYRTMISVAMVFVGFFVWLAATVVSKSERIVVALVVAVAAENVVIVAVNDDSCCCDDHVD